MSRNYLQGKRIGIVADLPHALGLCSLLKDLGCVVVFVGLRGAHLGSKDDFLKELATYTLTLEEGVSIWEDKSLHYICREFEECSLLGEIDGVIASATEINALEQGERPASIPFALEFGFPCKRHHSIRPQPYMGYTGILSFADRLINAPLLRYS